MKTNLQKFFTALSFMLLIICYSKATQAQGLEINSNTTLQTNNLSAFHLLPLSSTQADETAFKQEVPKLKAKTIAGQFIIGQLLGGAAGFVSGLAAIEILKCSRGYFCGFGEFVLGASLGYVGGSALGVYLIGNNANRKASYPMVLLGDAIGFGFGMAILNQFGDSSRKAGKILAGISIFILPLVGAILAYSLSSKKPQSNGKQALLNFGNNKTAISTPSLSMISTSSLINKKFIPGVAILNFKF